MATGDTIRVHNLDLAAKHGVYDEERKEGRRFSIDVDVRLGPAPAGQTDALGDTVDYRDVAQAVVDVMEGPSVHLIETLAEQICETIFTRLSRVAHVRVAMRKYATGVPGSPEWVGLEIERSRDV